MSNSKSALRISFEDILPGQRRSLAAAPSSLPWVRGQLSVPAMRQPSGRRSATSRQGRSWVMQVKRNSINMLARRDLRWAIGECRIQLLGVAEPAVWKSRRLSRRCRGSWRLAPRKRRGREYSLGEPQSCTGSVTCSPNQRAVTIPCSTVNPARAAALRRPGGPIRGSSSWRRLWGVPPSKG